jgi:hypothetical protein
VKSELAFIDSISTNGVTNGKEKDSRTSVVGVETGAEKEFIILTVRVVSCGLAHYFITLELT